MPTNPKQIALFDLDNTLIEMDSDVAWAQYLVELGVVDRDWYSRRNDEFYAKYKAGTLSIFEFLEFQLKPLATHSPAQLHAWRDTLITERIAPKISQSARDLVESHRAAGDLMAIVTATNRFITAPIAELFGIENLIATELEEKDGRFTGRPEGVPSFREGKITRVAQWLAQRDTALEAFERSYFYSDSLNDLPLMSRVTHPVVVNPDPSLLAHAKAQNWPVILITSQA
ncbi:MAG: HAD family hydrolase [Betaproteobacteria bacterium]|nr:HAD family hydrolase [Betaproteobacteria bacterium]